MLKSKYDMLLNLVKECDEEVKLYEIMQLVSERIDEVEKQEAEEEEGDDDFSDATDVVIIDSESPHYKEDNNSDEEDLSDIENDVRELE